MGGGLTHLLELLRAANPSQLNIEQVVVWAGKNTLAQLPVRPWLTKVYQEILDKVPWQRTLWQQTTLFQLAGNSCDLLFIPGGTYLGSFRPFVSMSRNMLPFNHAERLRYGLFSKMYLKQSILHFTQSQTYKNASGMIYLTESAKLKIEKEIGQSKANMSVVIPHGIDPRFKMSPREQKPILQFSIDNPYRLLYVSTVDVFKHQWHVVEAVTRLRQKGYPIILDLVGSGYPPAMQRLERVIQKNDPENQFVNYYGQVNFSELHHWYQQADAFIFASSCENLPNILIEAMASGLPIISSNADPMPGILGDAGLYFPSENVNTLVAQIEAVLTDQNLREDLAIRGFQRSHAYSWDRCANETFSFMAHILEASLRGRLEKRAFAKSDRRL